GYVGGVATANISNTVISWNPVSNTWSTLPNMLGERARMTGSVLGSSFYVIGGRSIASSGFVGTNDNQKLTCGGGTPTPTATGTPPSPTPTATFTPTPTATATSTGTPQASPTCAPLSEGLEDITTLTGAGWVQINHST